MSEPVNIRRGVRQGCVLSPLFFNVYTDFIFREIDEADSEEDTLGIKVGGYNINNLRYADDTVLIARSEEKLQILVNTVKEESSKFV